MLVCAMKVVAAFQLEVLQQLCDLYLKLLLKYRTVDIKAKSSEEQDISELSFIELRDKILALDPLDKDLVVKANQAEADFWRKSEGYRVGWNDEILGFDCGGQFRDLLPFWNFGKTKHARPGSLAYL
ncbi:hypothetical protein IFM89_002815 [Coptis chinensis]|uniref:Uncharacterized protein n=1 Tax=Coptis chinensis TaxID=261450 RepID=A0A835HQW3_9MAGN|nr:hypothetical protein IFM89_002815 [Coptis chinensis]